VVRALEDVKTGKPADARQSAEVEIEVRYDGIDLDESALVLGVSVPELVSAHSRQEWQVDLMGFAPGFGYLVPIGERMVDWPRLPRRDRPRESVPRGSVAIAAGMSAVYPAAMPGGWHLLGTTEAHLFDATMRLQPSLLVPGSRVRFREVSR
jgi:KipI family sensor histidine kinase inhibitor